MSFTFDCMLEASSAQDSVYVVSAVMGRVVSLAADAAPIRLIV